MRLGRLVFAAAAVALAIAPTRAATFHLFDGKTVAGIAYDGGEPIHKVAAMLASDLGHLTGKTAAVAPAGAAAEGPLVIVGPMDSPAIAALLQANRIDTAPLAGKWESYGRAVVAMPDERKALLIFGSDVRGTIYGVVDLTREMGVSPWEWWADVAPRRVSVLAVDAGLHYSKEPSVKYRAIFLNDEDFGLKPWAAKTFEPEAGTIGPKTYARIFELMWRLKADTLWPAMHKGTVAFDEEPGNAEMADSYAVIHATSHAEPMLRNNDREWDSAKRGPFNWRTNRAQLLDYWDGAVDSHKQFENIYTLGLRGVGDVQMQGADGPAQMRDILTDVFAQQRAILEHRLGKPANRIPQVFTPYKEVLPAYDTGLNVPDDVTLTWPDDNFGYIRRLSNAAERARSGGSGVYYHISYWGGPMSYLWLASQHPALIWEEMNKAYRFGARRIWVLNVGDIKPGEYLTQLFLDMAWDNGAFPDIAHVRAHLRDFAARTFGAEHADEIADLQWRHYDLAFSRKPEFMGFNAQYPVTTAPRRTDYNMDDFGDENARRADAYGEIAARAEHLRQALPPDRRDAFFELVAYPVLSAAAINERALDIDTAIAFGLQRRASATAYAAEALDAHRRIVAAADYYNGALAGGKWRGMMDIAPARLPQFSEPAYPAWAGVEDETCALQAEGGAYDDIGGATPALPVFQREVPRERYIDLFLKSPAQVAWTATPDAPWIHLDRVKGTFGGNATEQRLHVSVDWKTAPDGGQGSVALGCEGTATKFQVTVRVAPRNAVTDVSFLESERIVSIYATHADATSGAWETLDGLGHTGASLRSRLENKSVDDPAAAPSATYRFATTTGDDKASLRVVALPTLPITSENGLRVAASIDGAAPAILDLKAPEFSAAWRQNVLTNTAVGVVNNLVLKPGAHVLKVWALDPGVILDRYEIAFDGAPRAYDPVPETRIVK
ncbi:MAG: glycosyl hydrolase 115 family protein [Rhizomicrobium sp.]